MKGKFKKYRAPGIVDFAASKYFPQQPQPGGDAAGPGAEPEGKGKGKDDAGKEE